MSALCHAFSNFVFVLGVRLSLRLGVLAVASVRSVHITMSMHVKQPEVDMVPKVVTEICLGIRVRFGVRFMVSVRVHSFNLSTLSVLLHAQQYSMMLTTFGSVTMA